MNARKAQQDAMLMALILMTMVACSSLIGGLGIVNYLNGETLKAISSLVVPAYMGYWAWQARDDLRNEPLIPIFTLAWLCGLPIGLIAHKISLMST